jgi:CheY-like chemotaxis protein
LLRPAKINQPKWGVLQMNGGQHVSHSSECPGEPEYGRWARACSSSVLRFSATGVSENYALADNTEVRPTRVLVAEDDADAREMLVEALREEGYQVIEVENGRQLAKCLVKPYGHTCPRPDVVISDIRMPGHTGLEVLAALRESDWAMPVILVTAFGDEDTHEEARRLGAALVVDKPCSVELMVHAVRNTVPPSI